MKNEKLKFYGIIILYYCLILTNLSAQTCCSGGVPTSSNLGLPASDANTFQFSLNYDFNVLNTLKTGTKKESQPQSFRRTHTVMLQSGFSITKYFSIDAFIPWIRQERRSNVNNSEETTHGIGDIVLLFKYKMLDLNQSKTKFTLGIGPELPTGPTHFKNSIGSILLADLQPGSGSWDVLFWGQLTQVLVFRPSMSLIAQSSYKINSENDNFGEAPFTFTYKFGNEFQWITGISDRIVIGKHLFDPAILFRYRNAKSDQRKPNNLPQEFVELPSTGGQWVFINPSITYWINPDWSVNINGEVPVFANISGTQVTPTYRLNIGIYYRISFNAQASDNFSVPNF